MKPTAGLSCLVFASSAVAAAPAPARPRAQACPTGARLLEAARRAFPWVTADSGTLACRAVRTPAPAWLITVEATGGGAVAVIRNGAVVWSAGHETVPGTPCLTYTWRVVDLDGDGSDELLQQRRYEGHEGSWNSSLDVLPLGGSVEGSSSLGLGSSSGFDRLWRCASTLNVIKGPRGTKLIELVGTRSAPDLDDEQCPRPGRHTYAWRHGALEEAPH